MSSPNQIISLQFSRTTFGTSVLRRALFGDGEAVKGKPLFPAVSDHDIRWTRHLCCPMALLRKQFRFKNLEKRKRQSSAASDFLFGSKGPNCSVFPPSRRILFCSTGSSDLAEAASKYALLLPPLHPTVPLPPLSWPCFVVSPLPTVILSRNLEIDMPS